MKKVFNIIVLLTLMINAGLTTASKEIVHFDDPETKQRYDTLLEELRCLVCQNQSLADSGAGLADDLREEVERMLREGKTDDQVRDFMVERYGDFVLYEPPLKTSTILLWFSPFIFIGFAAVYLVWFLTSRSERSADEKISEVRRKRAAAILAAKDSDNE